MGGIRKLAASARLGTQAEADWSADLNNNRLERLHRWVLVFASAETVLAALPMYFGVRLPTIVFVFALVVTALLFGFINWWTATAVHDKAPPAIVPRARGWFAFAVGLAMMCGVISWTFDAEIEQARKPAGIPAQTMEIERLRQEKDMLRVVAERPVSPPDQDADVRRLQQKVDDVTAEFGEAKRNELCELDGTCGTQVPGVGKAYNEKVAYSNQVKVRLDAASAELSTARSAAQGRFEQRGQERDSAVRRIAYLDGRLQESPPSAGERRAWITTLFAVGDEQPIWAIVVSVGTLGLFFVFDLFGFRFIARRIYRRIERRRPFKEKILKGSNENGQEVIPAASFLRPGDER
jgi:hypothetical protein